MDSKDYLNLSEEEIVELNKELRAVESGEKDGNPNKLRQELRDKINTLMWWLNEG